ncbi:calcium/sodium antiporter [Desulfobacter vibrioformis]|uniref:calcium/sodium antiporter n=1 Tax=Desulfobacter vibrioformis TaxID=34031 RepID=UPI000A0636DE|nr:calcium/sodium antiporter [Desulfobacter vibrioformis]
MGDITVALPALIFGLLLLVWSADRFVEGAAATARHFGVPPLIIGMVIVGFGTSTPEMLVSALAALKNSPGIAIGNAYGSNIANIGLILGITALINPIMFRSNILRKELPILTIITGVSIVLLMDLRISLIDGIILLVLFIGLLSWTLQQGIHQKADPMGMEMERELKSDQRPLGKAVLWLFIGLVLLIISSRILVWGAVQIAMFLGVSDMIIGLTVVALGTSLPELASSILSVKKGEHDIALGNVLGSNLFNTLAVVGIAGVIHPFEIPAEALVRDTVVMTGLTLSLFIIGFGFRGRPGRINRIEGLMLLLVYIVYTIYLARLTLKA